MMQTFYWHDYETWGVNPSLDWPSQFAGVRTDWDLNIIDEPLVLYNQPPLDRLPHPQACLVTGITPQQAWQQGLPEPEFARQIFHEFNQANTCGVGYNSLKFDDEVTRHLLYRNFFPIYEREWKQGNSRWDLIDVMRLCYALRPDEIAWPQREDGTPSFKLEDLAQANQLQHDQAHDALSDVYATIAIAKLLKQKKPKLFDYALGLRHKQQVLKVLNVAQRQPVLFTSAYFPAQQACTSLVMPIAWHPDNKNAVILIDLRYDPSDLLTASVEEISKQLYLNKAQREISLPIVSLQVNRSPMLSSAKLLDDNIAQKLHLDTQQCWQHYQQIIDSNCSLLEVKLKAVYVQSNRSEATGEQAATINCLAEQQLYSGGFFNGQDVQTFDDIRNANTQAWQAQPFMLQDPRLNQLLSLYQARYFPTTLSAAQQQAWLHHCHNLLGHNGEERSVKQLLTVDVYLQALEDLPDSAQALKNELRDWPAQQAQLLENAFKID